MTKINAAEKAPADIGACVLSSFQSKRPSTAWAAAHKGYPVPRRDAGFAKYGPNRIEKIAQ